jgi:hypothetical protein
LLRKNEHKIRQEGVTSHDTSTRIAREAREARRAGTFKRADEQPAAEVGESPRHRLLQGLGINPDTMEVETSGAETRAPAQPPEERSRTGAMGPPAEEVRGFARELASAMSAIASLVIRSSGRSVSNGGWLYFDGASDEYHPFRAKCRLYQKTITRLRPWGRW